MGFYKKYIYIYLMEKYFKKNKNNFNLIFFYQTLFSVNFLFDQRWSLYLLFEFVSGIINFHFILKIGRFKF